MPRYPNKFQLGYWHNKQVTVTRYRDTGIFEFKAVIANFKGQLYLGTKTTLANIGTWVTIIDASNKEMSLDAVLMPSGSDVYLIQAAVEQDTLAGIRFWFRLDLNLAITV